MEQTGEVVSVSGNKLTVTFCRDTDCEKCGACLMNKKKTQIVIEGQAEPGDHVLVGMPAANVMKASVIAYMLPLAGLIGGLGAGLLLGGTDLACGLGGLIGLAIAVYVLRWADKQIAGRETWQPQLMRVISAKEGETLHE